MFSVFREHERRAEGAELTSSRKASGQCPTMFNT